MLNPTQLQWHALNERERDVRKGVRTEDERKRELEKKKIAERERERERNNIIIIQYRYSTILHIRWYCSSIVRKFTS